MLHVPGSNCKRHTFLIGWPIRASGGVSEVVRSPVRECSSAGDFAPVVIENCEPEKDAVCDESSPLRCGLLSPYDPKRPWRAAAVFCAKLPKALWHWQKTCRELQLEVVNPHFVGPEYFLLAVAKQLRVSRAKLILSFHGSDIHSMLRSRGWERLLCRALLRRADWLVPCSEGLAEQIRRFAPDCAERIRPIPNGLDAARLLAESESEAELPDAFRGGATILTVGAYQPAKGHDILLHAFAELRRTRPDVRLVIAGGSGPEFGKTEALVRGLGLADAVLLLRDVPHARVAALLKAADLFVLPSRREGFAMVLLEAGAAGKPVVAARACGVAELLTNGENGWTVPVERPDCLAQAMAEALANPEERARRADRLKARVLEEFTWARARLAYAALAQPAEQSRGKEAQTSLPPFVAGASAMSKPVDAAGAGR